MNKFPTPFVTIFTCMGASFLGIQESNAQQVENPDYQLVWADDFQGKGAPDPSTWQFEEGFTRNHELQWYSKKNAVQEDGYLKIIAKRERRKNPNYEKGSQDWRRAREYAEYTSSSITTRASHAWLYGRFEVRARINAQMGSWPAIWLLGTDREWPQNGEIDMMEFYHINGEPCILANACWGTEKRYSAKWDSEKIGLRHFTEKDPRWLSQFHVWRMDWTKDYVRLYLDDELLNEIDLSQTLNADGFNPFHQPQYLLLNLAIGGDNGGDPSRSDFPLLYEIDYVKVYQSKK